jgi:hypothetical protein
LRNTHGAEITDPGYNALTVSRYRHSFFGPYRCRGCCLPVPIEIGRRLRAVKITPVGDGSAGAFQSEQHKESEPIHGRDATKCSRYCQCEGRQKMTTLE